MKEINQEVKKEFINSFNAALKAAGKTEIKETDTKQVGNNGYVLGQCFTLTGKVEPVTTNINDNKTVFIGLEIAEGGYLSLQRVMGLSSLAGYAVDTDVINEYDVNGEKKTTKVSPYVKNGVTVEQLEAAMYKPSFRDLYDEAAYLIGNPETIRDKKLYYGGKVVRQITAKKDSTVNNFEAYKKGYKRAMVAPIFTETKL